MTAGRPFFICQEGPTSPIIPLPFLSTAFADISNSAADQAQRDCPRPKVHRIRQGRTGQEGQDPAEIPHARKRKIFRRTRNSKPKNHNRKSRARDRQGMGRAQAGARARPLLYCALLHADILPPQRGEWSPGGPRRQSLCRHCTEKHTATVTAHYLPENCPFIAPSAAKSATAGGFYMHGAHENATERPFYSLLARKEGNPARTESTRHTMHKRL